MRHGRTVIVAALAFILAPQLDATPAQAQDPGRILRPLTSPLRMILRGVPRARAPRAHRSARAYRAPRASREIATGAPRAVTRRQLARGAAVFWPIAAPDAFEDMLGYAFWPNEYGPQFWAHGPADILRAMTAPVAAFASLDDEDRPSRRRLQTALVTTTGTATDSPASCIARVKDQAVRPLDRIAQTVTLMAAQRDELNALRASVRAAIESETAACRADLPPTQPERLRAMIDGLWAMRYAEFRIRPALEAFYGSLTDAQKAQFADEPRTVGSNDAAPAPATVCRQAMAADSNPFDPIQRALQATDEQRKSLQMLYGASMEMAQFLTSTCPAETPSTPIARLDAASDRVMALLHAAMGIEPMLGEFYASLSDEQRRRFNASVR
jgi:LTXXQ motif family protein